MKYYGTIICAMHDVQLVNGSNYNNKQWQILVDGLIKVKMYRVCIYNSAAVRDVFCRHGGLEMNKY